MWSTLSHFLPQRKMISGKKDHSLLESTADSGIGLHCVQGLYKILEEILLHTAAGLFGSGC